MTGFVSKDALDLTLSDFAQADSTSQSNTFVFPDTPANADNIHQLGSYVINIPLDYAGTQVAALPDTFELDDAIVQDETVISHITIFGIANDYDANGHLTGQSIHQIVDSQSQPDEVLPTLFPDDWVRSDFAKVIIPSLDSSIHWAKLYAVVEGSVGDFPPAQYPDDPTRGRFLLTTGQVGGQRAAAWGDHWVNPVYQITALNPWDVPNDTVLSDAPTYTVKVVPAEPAKPATVTTQITGITLTVGGTATITDSATGQTSDWTPVSDVLAAIDPAAGSPRQIEAYVEGGVAGDLAMESLTTAIEATSDNADIAAVAAVSGQIAGSYGIAHAFNGLMESSLALTSQQMAAAEAGTVIDPDDINAQFKAMSVNWLVKAVSGLSGVTGAIFKATINLARQIDVHISHAGGTTDISTSWSSADSTAPTTLEKGHEDTYLGSRLANFLHLSDGNDMAYGAGGNDKLFGDGGRDIVLGGEGNDELSGGAGNDTLGGGAGDDVLNGDGGADRLSGGTGNDTLIGGAGKDRLKGGAGADHFVFKALTDFGGKTPTTCDTIADFKAAQGDRIDLRAIDANTTTGHVNEAFAWIGTSAFSHHAGELRYEIADKASVIYGDVNGDGLADFALRLTGAPALDASCFSL